MFLIGPQFQTKQPRPETLDCFLPTIYVNVKQAGRKEGSTESEEVEMKPFKLMVFIGLKTIVVLFMKHDYEPDVRALTRL